MARLVYNPVTAPNWNISGTLALANNVLNQASQNFSRALKDFQQTDQNNADRILRERMLGLKTEDDFYNALSSGSLLEGIKNRISSEAARQVWQNRNELLNQDKTRLQYQIDSALAGASDLQSAIEVALTNGDAAGYNRIIGSEEFKNLPVQAQQKLMGDITQRLLNRARVSSIGKADRVDNEAATLAEMFSEAERKNNPEGSIEMSQKNHDDIIAMGKARGFSDVSLQKFRNSTPLLTKTGFDGRTGGNVYDPGSLGDNFTGSLDSIGRVTINIPNKNNSNKSTKVTANASELLTDSVNRLKQTNRTIASNFGLGSDALASFYDTADKTRPEIIKTIKDSYSLDEEQTQNFSEEIDNIQKRYGFSSEEVAFGIAVWGMEFPRNANRLYEAKKQRGFKEAIALVQSNEKSIKSLEEADKELKDSITKTSSSYESYRHQPVTSKRKDYLNNRRVYENTLKKSSAVLADAVKKNQERDKTYQDALKVDRRSRSQIINEDIVNEIVRKNMQNVNAEIEKFNSLNR